MQIVPLSQNDIDTMVATFRLLTDEVRRTIPEVLLATMNILFTNYKSAKATTSSTSFNTTEGNFASKSADGGR